MPEGDTVEETFHENVRQKVHTQTMASKRARDY